MRYIQHPKNMKLIPENAHKLDRKTLTPAISLSAGSPSTSVIDLSRIGDVVESITKITEHLAFARGLVRKHVTSAVRKLDFEVRITSIETRARDRRLNLAVIGEFNSGKSTFINALLRQRLLKAACIATTATATYIQLGKEFSVATTFKDDTQVRSTNTSYSNLLYRLQKIKPDLSQKATLSELLDLLTSEQSIANIIKRIDITVPAEHLSEDIVIIDTPGINAGAHGTESHGQVTKHVLEQSADSAVVLVPASSAMTDTLLNFLLQNVKPFLHRCVFVLTAMDQLDPNDRQELVRMVKLKIREKLKLLDALVLESSAITMIPVKTIPISMMTEDTWSHWQSQFVQIETNLKQVMLRQRSMIITERVVRLLQELVNELSDDLDRKKIKLDQEQKVLRENSVAAIEEVMTTLLAQSKAKIVCQQQAIKSQISTKKSTHRTIAKSSANKFINDSGYNKNYDDEVAPKIQTTVEQQGISYTKEIDTELKKLRDCCESVSANFVRQFELNYKAFPSLGVNLSVPSISVASISVPLMSFSSSRTYVEQQNDNDDTGGGIGAVIGGVIGFFLGGPPGAAIGIGLGGVGGAGMAGDTLEQRQSTLSSYAGSDIEKFFDKYHSELVKQLDRIVDNILYQLQQAANSHVKEYGAKVGLLIEKHLTEEKRLMREIEEAISDSQDISMRKNHLEKLKQQLLQS